MFDKLFEEMSKSCEQTMDEGKRKDILARVIDAIEEYGYVLVNEDELDLLDEEALRIADEAIGDGDVQKSIDVLEEEGLEFKIVRV